MTNLSDLTHSLRRVADLLDTRPELMSQVRTWLESLDVIAIATHSHEDRALETRRAAADLRLTEIDLVVLVRLLGMAQDRHEAGLDSVRF